MGAVGAWVAARRAACARLSFFVSATQQYVTPPSCAANALRRSSNEAAEVFIIPAWKREREGRKSALSLSLSQ